MARTYRGLALLVLAVASTASLDAQHRQFVLTTGVLFEVETDPRGYGQVRAPVPVLPSFRSAFPGELHVVAGGRYLAWATVTGALSVASTSVLSVFDVHTRHVQVLSLVSFANVPPAVAFRLIGDPLRPRLLVQHSTRVAIIDPPGVSPRYLALPFDVATSGEISLGGLLAYAPRAERVFLLPARTGRIIRLDLATGSIHDIGIPIDAVAARTMHAQTDAAGSRLFLISSVGPTITLTSYDVESGAMLGRRTVADRILQGTVKLDEARGRLLLLGDLPSPSVDTEVMAFDAGTLDLLGARPKEGSGTVNTSSRLLTASAAPYVLSSAWRLPTGPCQGATLTQIDPVTGARRAHTDVLVLWAPYTGAQPCAFTTVLLSPPAAPATMPGVVVDRQVTLEWHGAADATDYEVQAGSAPGLQNLAMIRTGGASTLQFDAVPPGTYFVRVVGINEVGRSAASAEIVVTVR